MRFPPDQFLSALRATRCPDTLMGRAARINIYGEEDIRREALLMAWGRGVEVAGRDIETLFPNQQTAALGLPPLTLGDETDPPDRIVVADELMLARMDLTVDGITPGQRAALRAYCSAVERAYRSFIAAELPALRAFHRAAELLTASVLSPS